MLMLSVGNLRNVMQRDGVNLLYVWVRLVCQCVVENDVDFGVCVQLTVGHISLLYYRRKY